jgi:hypothetical protein
MGTLIPNLGGFAGGLTSGYLAAQQNNRANQQADIEQQKAAREQTAFQNEQEWQAGRKAIVNKFMNGQSDNVTPPPESPSGGLSPDPNAPQPATLGVSPTMSQDPNAASAIPPAQAPSASPQKLMHPMDQIEMYKKISDWDMAHGKIDPITGMALRRSLQTAEKEGFITAMQYGQAGNRDGMIKAMNSTGDYKIDPDAVSNFQPIVDPKTNKIVSYQFDLKEADGSTHHYDTLAALNGMQDAKTIYENNYHEALTKSAASESAYRDALTNAVKNGQKTKIQMYTADDGKGGTVDVMQNGAGLFVYNPDTQQFDAPYTGDQKLLKISDGKEPAKGPVVPVPGGMLNTKTGETTRQETSPAETHGLQRAFSTFIPGMSPKPDVAARNEVVTRDKNGNVINRVPVGLQAPTAPTAPAAAQPGTKQEVRVGGKIIGYASSQAEAQALVQQYKQQKK